MTDLPGHHRYDHEMERELAQHPELGKLDRPTVPDGRHLVHFSDASLVRLEGGRRFLFTRFRYMWGDWQGEPLDVAALERSSKLLSISLALGLGWPPEDIRDLDLTVPVEKRLQVAEVEAVEGLGSVVRWLEPPTADDLIHLGGRALDGLRGTRSDTRRPEGP